MALTVLARPEAQLVEGSSVYYISRWTASELPIVYEIESDIYPTNTVDSAYAFASVANSGGYAQLYSASGFGSLVAGDTVDITTTGNYPTSARVRSATSTTLTIDTVYTASSNGTVKKKYTGYAIVVKVFVGLPETHPMHSSNPIAYVGSFAVSPSLDNTAKVDVGGFVRSQLSVAGEFLATGTISKNDLLAATGFYVSFAERYDVPNASGVPESETGVYEIDYLDGCSTPPLGAITSFTSTSRQATAQEPFVSNGYAMVADFNAYELTESLRKTGLALKAGISYKLTVDYYVSCSGATMDVYFAIGKASDTPANTGLKYRIGQTQHNGVVGNQTTQIEFTPLEDCDILGMAANLNQRNATSFIYFLSATFAETVYDEPDCTRHMWVAKATRQFYDIDLGKSAYAGNMGEYVQNYNEGTFANKFLTTNTDLELFAGNYFDISSCLPQDVLDIPYTEDGLLLEVTRLDSQLEELSVDNYEVVNEGDGIYRHRLDELTEDAACLDVRLHREERTKLGLLVLNGQSANQITAIYNGATIQLALPNCFGAIAQGTTKVRYIEKSGSSPNITYALKELDLSNNSTITVASVVTSVDFSPSSARKLANGDYVAFHRYSTTGYMLGYDGSILDVYDIGNSILTAIGSDYIVDIEGGSLADYYAAVQTPANVNGYVVRMNGQTVVSNYSQLGIRFDMASNGGRLLFRRFSAVVVLGRLISQPDKYYLWYYGETSGQLIIDEAISSNAISLVGSSNSYTLTYTNATGRKVVFTTDYFATKTTIQTTDPSVVTVSQDSAAGNVDSILYTEVDGGAEAIERYKGNETTTTPAFQALTATGVFYRYSITDYPISEVKRIRVSSDCSRYNQHLSWVNELGGREHFNFRAAKSYSLETEDTQIVTTSTLADWPTNFNGKLQKQKASTKAKRIITMRSQYVSLAQKKELAKIIHSPQVWYWYDSNKYIGVLVVTDSIKEYEELDKTYSIEFDIELPDINTVRL